ncbi:MAG: glycosyltransferase family 39 protein [Candidatus Shapirobacteria bacterium]|jgi:4-amino-4-deoxy-L-arabinose transferase-like glycosyltransferase
MKFKLILTFFTLLIGLLLGYTRFTNLNSLPPSLFSDEVDAQYQAFVFNHLKTDYFGNRFPVHFHSFADWRTPLTIYVTALIQSAFPDFTDISVRLSSAIFGIGFVLVMSFFIYKAVSPISGVVSFLFLSFSPWLIHYSRTGFEATGMLFCLSLNLLFFYYYTKKHRLLFLTFSIVFLILSTYFYSTAKLFAVFIIVSEFFFWRSDIIKIKTRDMFKVLIISLIVALPLIRDTLLNRTGFRFSYISIFSNPQISKEVDFSRYQDILIDHPQEIGVVTPFSSKIFHNRLQYLWQNFYQNYISSFSTDFLLLKGDTNLRQGFADTSLLYPLDLILLLLGIYISFRKSKNNLNKFFLILLLLSPIPFSLTRDSLGPHATRLILFLLPFTYFISQVGLVINKRLLIPLTAIYFIFFLNFWHYYSLHYPQISARFWHTGIKETVLQVGLYPNTDIYFSNNPEPILPFFLFYSRYLPQNTSITQNIKNISTDFFDGARLGEHYYFGHLNWSSPPPSGLVVTTQEEVKNNFDFATNYKIILTFDKKYIEEPTYLLAKPINEN